MKIVSLNKLNWGKKRVIAFDGEVSIGEDGVVDVSEKAAEHLVANSPQWAYQGREDEKLPNPEEKEEKVDLSAENEALKKRIAELEGKAKEESKEEDAKEGVEEEVKEPNVANVAGQSEEKEESEEDKAKAQADKLKQAREVLEGKKKGELQELCVKKEFPKEEWEDLLKKDLIEYLMGKV